MFNEFQVEMIAIAVVLGLLAVYLIVRRSSGSKLSTLPPKIEEEMQSAVSEAQSKPISKLEVTPVPEEKSIAVASRRKSDTTIPKRSVPEHITVTKQNFSEFAGERILVAEDNTINQKVIVGLLAGSGIEVVLANDGQEALDILENDTHFLMILMDAHMPRVDGFEATRTIRENPKYDHIVVVALSGDVASDDIVKMKNAGMTEQLAKPLRMESLYKIIYAYSAKVTHQEAIMTKILDADEGLQTCGGDENFYREILSEFMRDYGDSSDRLGELLRSHNLKDADAYLLDIIGVAANIGARSLVEIASDMKIALGDTQEQSYFSLFDQYKVHSDRLMQEIKKNLSS